jgi:hypothetical protein
MLKVTADVRTNSVVDVNQLLADTFMVGQASDIFVVRLKKPPDQATGCYAECDYRHRQISD